MASISGKIDFGLAVRSHMDEATDVCGDIGLVKESGADLFIALLDILGHGSEANDAANQAKRYLEKADLRDSLIDIAQGLHEHLKGTRGAAAALCRLNRETRNLKYVGVGNITTRVCTASPTTLVSRDGVVGYMMPTPREEVMDLPRGTVLILHTDGVSAHTDLTTVMGQPKCSAQVIVNRIVDEFGKKDDDVGCIVVKM